MHYTKCIELLMSRAMSDFKPNYPTPAFDALKRIFVRDEAHTADYIKIKKYKSEVTGNTEIYYVLTPKAYRQIDGNNAKVKSLFRDFMNLPDHDPSVILLKDHNIDYLLLNAQACEREKVIHRLYDISLPKHFILDEAGIELDQQDVPRSGRDKASFREERLNEQNLARLIQRIFSPEGPQWYCGYDEGRRFLSHHQNFHDDVKLQNLLETILCDYGKHNKTNTYLHPLTRIEEDHIYIDLADLDLMKLGTELNLPHAARIKLEQANPSQTRLG